MSSKIAAGPSAESVGRRDGELFTDHHLSRNLRQSPAARSPPSDAQSHTRAIDLSVVVRSSPPFANPCCSSGAKRQSTIGSRREPSVIEHSRRRERPDRFRRRALDRDKASLTELGAAERISGTSVTPGLLPLLGVAPALGRRLTTATSDSPWRLSPTPSGAENSNRFRCDRPRNRAQRRITPSWAFCLRDSLFR